MCESQEHPLLMLLLNIVLEILANAIREEKGIGSTKIWKKEGKSIAMFR